MFVKIPAARFIRDAAYTSKSTCISRNEKYYQNGFRQRQKYTAGKNYTLYCSSSIYLIDYTFTLPIRAVSTYDIDLQIQDEKENLCNYFSNAYIFFICLV